MVSKKEETIKEMSKNGLHLGHKVSKLHPSMKDYIVGIKNNVHIIDLKKTEACLKEALNFVSGLLKEDGNIILVGTKTPLRQVVRETAEESKIPYVTDRWIGGTFTNFREISKRIDYYNKLLEDRKEGKLEELSKKEKSRKEKEFKEMESKFEGIKDLKKVPEAVFICDLVKDDTALREAKQRGIKVVAVVDTNADYQAVDYPIPANDDAITSVKYILDKLKKTIIKSRK